MSSRPLTQQETSVLENGHSYNVTRWPRLLKIVAAFEEAVPQVNPNARDEIRLKLIGILSKLPLQKSRNLTAEERRALRQIQKDEKIVILPADKGNSTVVLDHHDYEETILALLDGDAYMELKKDPTNRTQMHLNKLLAEIFEHQPELKILPTFHLPKRLGAWCLRITQNSQAGRFTSTDRGPHFLTLPSPLELPAPPS